MTASEQESATVVFADIPGYTALTEAHATPTSAELAATFSGEISDGARQRRRGDQDDQRRGNGP
jgi:class 3 adenylate cyclase